MSLMSLRSLACAAFVSSLAACSSNGPAFEHLEHPPRLAAQSVELRLVDGRPFATEGFDVPMMSMPGDQEELAPPLDPGLQAELESTLREHLVPGPRSLRVEVKVLEGTASWSGNFASETEKGTARVSVTVFDATANRLLVMGVAESWAERSSLDTSESRVTRILGTAVQGATLEFLASETARVALAAP